MGLQNAIWLKVEKKILYKLIAVSSTLFILKIFLTYAIAHQIINLDENYIKIFGRVIGVVAFVVYYTLLKGVFKEHMSLNGKTQSLILPGIIWCVIAAVIEFFIIGFIMVSS